MKTNIGLVDYARAQLGLPYWYGTYGKEASEKLYEQKRKQYPQYYKWAYAGEAGVKVHDCVGLIKGYLWSESAQDVNPKYNAKQDKNANGMRSACNVAGSIDTLPEVPGVLVFFDGHVGVYEGSGKVIEARGHAYGVVRTNLKSRPWKSWGYCPYIEYVEDQQPQKEAAALYTPTVREWQLAAIADGFKLPEYGADGIWGRECESVAKKAIVKKRLFYKYHNLTKIVQKVVGVEVDGKCGSVTAAAIKEYQAAHGLKADGACGLLTWRKMLT
jgi:hypothetical protein